MDLAPLVVSGHREALDWGDAGNKAESEVALGAPGPGPQAMYK